MAGKPKPNPLSDNDAALLESMFGVNVDNLLAGVATQNAGGGPNGVLNAVMADMAQENQVTPLPPWAAALGLPNPLAPENATRVQNPFLGAWVYMGKRKPKITEIPATGDLTPRGLGSEPTGESTTVKTPRDKVRTFEQAMAMPFTWDDDEVADAIRRFQAAGLDVKTFDDLRDAWGGLVERAAMTYTATKGEKKITPWDALDMMKAEGEVSGLIDRSDDPNRRVVTRQRVIDEISEGEAWSAVQTTMSQMLGRDPSDQEVRDFAYRMNQLAAKNPAISKTITRYKNGDPVSQTTREIDPGLTEQDVAMKAYKMAQNDEMYAETQAATTYFEAALSALGAIGTT